MAKSIKLKNETYIDSSGCSYKKNKLSDYLDYKGRFLKVGLNNNQNINSQTTTRILWDKVIENNFGDNYMDNFTLSSGFIEIKNDLIKMVLVVASIQMSGCTDAYLYINKENSGRYATMENYGGGNSLVCVIPVNEGDRIFCEVYFSQSGSIGSWSDATFLQITSI